ncbi:unnamed protein product [Protopolystoma xenopodis]|uniref:Uncharacterized protein n=1 Tax=Protopolystoma xenopodis TaxID=117903 RepID=A0A448XGZ3_9PLAT|nr:unnamed protein product [Protopolystoma xenopodis]
MWADSHLICLDICTFLSNYRQSVVVFSCIVVSFCCLQVKIDYMGRVFCEVKVYVDGEMYVPSKLAWWPVYRGQTPAGEILASFELIQVSPTG